MATVAPAKGTRSHQPLAAANPAFRPARKLGQARLLSCLAFWCGHLRLVPQPFFLSNLPLSLLLLLRCLFPAKTCLGGGFFDRLIVVTPGVESPAHPVAESCCGDSIGSRVGHPLAADELAVRSTVRQ